MFTSRSPLQRLLFFPIAMMILASVVTTAIAQDAMPDLLASPLISEEQKTLFRALEQQLSQLADVDERLRRQAEQLSARRLALTVADVSDALLRQARVDTQRWQLRHEELAHRLVVSEARMKALLRRFEDLGTRAQLLQNPARQQGESSWYKRQLELRQQALVQVRFDMALEQKRLELFAIRLAASGQRWEMAQQWERRVETLMQARFQESSATVQGGVQGRLDLEKMAAYNRFWALTQQLEREADSLSDPQRRHLERKTELALDRSYAIAQRILINGAAEVLTDMENLLGASATTSEILGEHYHTIQQLETELATLADDAARRVEVYEKQGRLIQQRLSAAGEDREAVKTEATLAEDLLTELQQIQTDLGQHQGRAENIAERLGARHEEVRRAELFERRPSPLSADYRATLGTDFAKTPEVLFYQMQVSITSIVNAVGRLSPRERGVVIALELGLLAALIAFWYGSGRLESRLQSSVATSTFLRMAQVLLRLLRMNLLGVGLVLALVALTRVLFIAAPSEAIVLTLIGVGVGTKLASNLMWLLLAHPDLPPERRFPGVYRLLAMTIWIGGLLVAVMALAHLSGLPHSVLDALDRLFMVYLLLVTLPVLRLRRLLNQHLLSYYGRRPWVTIVRLSNLLIPVALLGVGLAGMLGYLNLAWLGARYLLVFSAVLLGWRLSQQLLYDLADWLKQRAFDRSRKEWVAVRRVVEALQRVVGWSLLLLAVFVLIRFYSLDEAIVGAWTVLMAAVIVVMALYEIVFLLADYGVDKSGGTLIGNFVGQARKPLGLILPVAAAQVALPRLALPEDLIVLGGHALILLQIAAITWLFLRLIALLEQVSEYRYRRTDVKEDLVARRARTQLRVLRQALHLTAIVIGVGAMLMTFPGVRQFGAGLLASAGAAGLVIGIAARPLFENLIAGIQLALTQPIRLDDVVIVEGEWGTIEEINATYVVVQIWDDRRLVLPLKYFNEHPFQHWSRKGTELLGSVFLSVDYSFPVEEGRKALKGILDGTDLWDKRAWVLQVTDLKEHSMELRALATAHDAGTAWDLRCYVREKLIAFIQQNYPESLPQLRTQSASDTEQQPEEKRAAPSFVLQGGEQGLP